MEQTTGFGNNYDLRVSDIQYLQTVKDQAINQITITCNTDEVDEQVITELYADGSGHKIAAAPRGINAHKHAIRLAVRERAVIGTHLLWPEHGPFPFHGLAHILSGPAGQVTTDFKGGPSFPVKIRREA